MNKFTTLVRTLALATTILAATTWHQTAQADTTKTTDAIAQVKQLAPGQIPDGVKLAADQTFRGHLKDDPTSFDPDLINDSISQVAINPIYDPLVRQAENGQYIPTAAESYSVSADGKTWTFKLRKEAKWQDGKPVTAQDFVYAFQRLTDPKTASVNGNFLHTAHVLNAKAVNDGKLPVSSLGVKALDNYTLQIQLDSPTPWLVQMLGGSTPLRKDLIEKYGKDWVKPENLVGNGPFKLTKYNPNDELDYVKWNGYWDAKNVHLNAIKYYIIKSDNSAYLKYLSGGLDITDTSATNAVLARKERPDEVVTAPIKAVGFLAFDYKKVPYVIRHAIALTIDTKFLVNKILKTDTPTSIFVPTSIQDAEGATPADYYHQDIKDRRAQAIKELEAAGYTPQHPYTITLLHQNVNVANLSSNAFRAWINKGLGGRIVYKDVGQEVKTFFQSAQEGKYPFSYVAWGIGYDQASTLYNSLICNDPENTLNYCNPEYDKIVEEASHTLDKAKRVDLYRQANALIQKDLPVIPVFWFTSTYLRNPRLGGYNPEVYPIVPRDLYIIAGKDVAK